MKKRYLVLSDGTVYQGAAVGADVERVGELVFTTGMCGYLETLTDPSYYGQIVLQTFPLIGNYGVIPADFEGGCHVRGYVTRELCAAPSNFRCEYSLERFLSDNGVPGITGVDTRELTRRIRERGVTNAILCDSVPADLSSVRDYVIRGAVEAVTCPAAATYPAQGEERSFVVLMDFGAKANILRSLQQRGCRVTVVPAGTPARDILAMGPDGVMLSNGPGDPADNTAIIGEIAALMGQVPIFGICLGHQLMALSQGAQTVKLKYGHRGVNHPVKDLRSGRTYITSQNHGYAVVSESLKNGVLRWQNANDGTCEGIDYPGSRAFSVQFHPEACAGPLDTGFLFDRFCQLMREGVD